MQEEWGLPDPLLPGVPRCGRRRAWPLRAIINAIFHVLRAGCAWRLLPDSFPPWQRVYRWFARLRDGGAWEAMNHRLVMRDRERCGRETSPTAAGIDSQSVKTTESGGPPLMRLSRRRWPFVRRAFMDGGYAGDRVANATSIRVEIVRKPQGQVGLAVHARRRVAEHSFASIGRNRRLARDFAATIASANAFLYAASVGLLRRRIAPSAWDSGQTLGCQITYEAARRDGRTGVCNRT